MNSNKNAQLARNCRINKMCQYKLPMLELLKHKIRKIITEASILKNKMGIQNKYNNKKLNKIMRDILIKNKQNKN